MRVVLISILSVFFVATALYGARIYGLQTPYQRFEHPFWSGDKPLWSVNTRNAEEIKRLTQVKPDIVPWLDLQLSSDGHLVVIPQSSVRDLLTEKSFGPERWRGPQAHRYTLAELRMLFPDAASLGDLLTEFSELRFILNVPGQAPDIDRKLLAALDPLNPEKRVLIHCETDGILKDLKEERPRWLYSSSRADLMRWLSFESIGLLPATPFRGDVFFAPLSLKERSLELRPLVSEAHRRQKDFFVGPMNHSASFEEAKRLGADGYIFATFELFLALLDQKSL